MIDSFTKQDFEIALHNSGVPFKYAGMDLGEHTYLVPVDETVALMIRSSIRSDNQSADTGTDSIRAWLLNRKTDFPIGKSATRFITRRPGWSERLVEQLKLLTYWRRMAGDCLICHKPKSIFIAGANAKEENRGKPFANCMDRTHKGQFTVLKPTIPPGYPVSLGATLSPATKEQTTNQPSGGGVVPSGAGERERSGLEHMTHGAGNFHADCPMCQAARAPMELPDAPRLSDTGHRDANNSQDQAGRDGVANVLDRVHGDDFDPPGATVSGDPAGAGPTPVRPVLSDPAAANSGTSPLALLGRSDLIVDAPAFIPQRDFVPSHYQQAIFDFIRGDNGNAVVKANAGTGKTATLVKSLDFTPQSARVAFIAYNVHIVNELKVRLDTDRYHISTIHSLGLANAKAHNPKIEINKFKLWDLWDLNDPTGELIELKPSVVKLVNLLKATMRPATQADMDYLIERFGIEVDGDIQKVYERSALLLKLSLAEMDTLDFDDMIYWCAVGKIPCQKFDYLYGDEWQDMNRAQIQMALNSVAAGGRMIVVGDPHQSIYGFRGADTDAIPSAIKELNATVLPLSICYRCHKGAVRLAQTLVPEIEWRPDAPEGIVEQLKYLPKPSPGDLVLCRTNAPLVKPCFQLIRSGIKATIKGRSIGDGLVQMLLRGKKLSGSEQPSQMFGALSQYVAHETDKLRKARRDMQAENLVDQFDTLLALSDGQPTFGKIKHAIAKTFSDDKTAVDFSTFHRAKGLEANTVYYLRPDLTPFPKATRDWEKEQERNIMYVGYTRPKQALYFVEKEG